MEEILRQYFDVFQPDIYMNLFESSIMAGVRFPFKLPWTDKNRPWSEKRQPLFVLSGHLSVRRLVHLLVFQLVSPLIRWSIHSPFWAAAPKGRRPVGHRGEFPDVSLSICPSVCPRVITSPPRQSF